MIGPTLLYRCT